MYLSVILALLCAGIICAQQDIGTDSEETQILYCTNRDQRSTRGNQRLRQVIAGKAGPIGPPGKVDYTAVNGTIKQYVKELSERKLSEIEQVVEGLTGASDQTQRQVTQCSEDIEALKTEVKNLQGNLDLLMTWHKAINGNFYKLFHDNVNYATAKANCKRYGAKLAAAGIRDDDVRRELIPLLKTGDSNTWIGLNDIEQEGNFYWEDGVIGSSIPWDDSQPNSSGGNQDCVEIASNWKWKLNDNGCSGSKKYLCEIAI